jgi:hypothetical protein
MGICPSKINEVVLRANPGGSSGSGNSRNTHDGNDYARCIIYHCLLPALSHLISESFGNRSSIATNELPRISPLGKSFVCTTT